MESSSQTAYEYSGGMLMGYYTPTLDNLIRNNFDIGLKDYPIFMEEHREQLNNKIIEHYRFREIGLETPMLFKLYLNRKMNEIMPYYNQLYESELLEFDPITNYEFKEKFDGKHTGNKVDTLHKTDTENKIADTTKDGSENEDKQERESIGTESSEHQINDSSTSVDENVGRSESSHNSTDTQNSTTNIDIPLENNSQTTTKNVYSDTPQGMLSGTNGWKDIVTNANYATNGGYTVQDRDLKELHVKTTNDNESGSQTDASANSDESLDRDTVTSETADTTANKDEDRETSSERGTQYVDNEAYEHDVEANSDSVGTSDVDNTDDNLTHMTGYKNVSPSDLLNKFRDTFLNIDMMIVDELNELFMSIY